MRRIGRARIQQETMSQDKQSSTEPAPSTPVTPPSSNNKLKYVSLMLLVVQNTSAVLLMRYSRTMEGPRYLTSTAVVVTEIMKFVACFFLVLHGNAWALFDTLKLLKYEIIDKYGETLKVSIPSFLYTLQNNLIYISLNYLDAATFSVTYQMKIFTVAIFSVILLKKQLSYTQWAALGMLAVAVVFVQWSTNDTNSSSPHAVSTNMRIFGVICVLIACVFSGFSGVYFEKMLKGSSTSVWIRNIQLGLLGFVFALTEVFIKDHDAVYKEGFFQGYNSVVWSVIIVQAIGGLVIAAVIKYADNILKGFATAVSIVLSSVLSYFLLADFHPTILFGIGTVFVICSIFLYGKKASTPPKPPTDPEPVKKEEVKESIVEKGIEEEPHVNDRASQEQT